MNSPLKCPLDLVRRNWVVFFVIFACHGVLALLWGVRLGSDSSTYRDWADLLIAQNFNYPAFLREVDSSFPPLLYTLFVTLVALCRVVAGEYWAQALIVLNLLAESTVGVLLVRAVWRLTAQRMAAWGALALYLVCYDILSWTPYVLTDSLFLLISFGIFSITLEATLEENERRARGLCTIAFALLIPAIFVRPPGILLLPATLAAFVLGRRCRGKKSLPTPAPAGARRRRQMLVLGSVAACVLLAVILHSYLMQDPERWPLQTLSQTIRYNAAHYAMGEVVYDRPGTFHAPPQTVLDFVAISADRFAHFFYFLSGEFSPRHNLLKSLFFVPTYLLAASALWTLWRGQSGLDGRRLAVVWSSLCFMAVFVGFHSLVQVDYDWRYRMPILPHLILLAALGIALRRVRRSRVPGAPA